MGTLSFFYQKTFATHSLPQAFNTYFLFLTFIKLNITEWNFSNGLESVVKTFEIYAKRSWFELRLFGFY